MRLRVIMLVMATSSLVLVSFLVPLALVLRTLATDHAISTATAQAQSIAPLVTALSSGQLTASELGLTVDQVNAQTSTPITVFLPSGTELGQPAPKSAAVRLAAKGRSFTAEAPDGEEVLVSVGGLPGGSAVIRTFVPDSVLRHGVARAWLLLGCVGLLLLALSLVVADLSHRLRTPLTALRIDAESLRDGAEMERLLADVDAVERTVSGIIHEARRPSSDGTRASCDAAEVIADRAGFWLPLAEDQDRWMTVELAPGPVPVRVSRDDLATCADVLLENVFAHTPEGAAFTIRLSRRASGGAWLVVADDGPGFGDVDPTQRGLSRGGSTGLGLDIARRIAEGSGGSLVVGRSASGGGAVTLGLGSPAQPPETNQRHGRTRLRLRA